MCNICNICNICAHLYNSSWWLQEYAIYWVPMCYGVWMLLSTIFQLYSVGQFHLCRKQEYPEKTTDMWQVNGKPYHIMLYPSTPRHERDSKLTTLLVIGTDLHRWLVLRSTTIQLLSGRPREFLCLILLHYSHTHTHIYI